MVLNLVLSRYLDNFGVKPVSEMMTMNEFRTRFLSGYLYSFGVKQTSDIIKMNDFRTWFWADIYIGLVWNIGRKSWKWTISGTGFEQVFE